MKKTTKLVLMFLASLIALVSVFCITSFATESEETLDVSLIKNIAVTDKIQALYAVKADENITVESAKLTVCDEDNNVVWSGFGVAENLAQFGGETYIVFYTNRVALYEIANFYYVQLDVNGVKSAVTSYSVAEYLFDKLYKDGFANKTEADGKDFNRKNFYNGLVQTGENAYEIINNDAKRSIADLVYVIAEGASLEKKIYTAGETVTLTYTGTAPAGYDFTGKWSSSIAGESIVNDGEAFVPSTHAVYTPCFEETIPSGPVLPYYDNEAVYPGVRYDFNDGVKPSAVVMNNAGGTTPTTVSVKEDATGNYVLYDNNTKKNFGFALTTGDSNKYSAGKYVFEADVCFDAVSNVASGGSLFAGLLGEFYYNGESTPTTRNNGGICYSTVNYVDESTYTWFGQTLSIGTTYKIALVYDIEINKCSVYVDGQLVAEESFTRTNTDDSVFYGVFFLSRQSGGCKYSLDNVYLGVIDGVVAE